MMANTVADVGRGLADINGEAVACVFTSLGTAAGIASDSFRRGRFDHWYNCKVAATATHSNSVARRKAVKLSPPSDGLFVADTALSSAAAKPNRIEDQGETFPFNIALPSDLFSGGLTRELCPCDWLKHAELRDVSR